MADLPQRMWTAQERPYIGSGAEETKLRDDAIRHYEVTFDIEI
jgi:hypothetical protein